MSEIESTYNSILGNLELTALPETAIPIDAIVLVRALDETGFAAWFTRSTAGLSDMDMIAPLAIAHQLAFDGALSCYVEEDSSDEDEDEDD